MFNITRTSKNCIVILLISLLIISCFITIPIIFTKPSTAHENKKEFTVNTHVKKSNLSLQATPPYNVPKNDNIYHVIATNLNIRNGPGENYPIVGELSIGDQIETIGNQVNGFYPIEFNGERAYINEQYLVQASPINNEGKEKPEQKMLDVPYVKQRPALPSGCEATSLTMALNYYGFLVTKEEIAQEHVYDNTELIRNENGSIHTWGNPLNGYVGDPFSVGYTMYPNALKTQAEQYIPSRDTTGLTLDELEYFIAEEKPVLVWVTIGYDIPNDRFWHTDDGEKIYAPTPLHNVVLTGYDQHYVYVNDPEDYGDKNFKIPKTTFEQVYNLMGMKSLVIG